jgi:hypothetical protein
MDFEILTVELLTETVGDTNLSIILEIRIRNYYEWFIKQMYVTIQTVLGLIFYEITFYLIQIR